MPKWLLVDDSPDEAKAFSAGLSSGDRIAVEYISAADACAALGEANFSAAGVLMDVDLSNELGRQQTGPGMSQDIRVAQHKQTIPSFPVVRFSLRDKIIENIGRDSSSDDIFDLKIEKDGLSNETLREAARHKLIGVQQVYEILEQSHADLLSIVGLSADAWTRWGSSSFQSDFELGDRTYLRAGPLVRMLVHPGLLIDEAFLAFRLGIDRDESAGWSDLIEALAEYAYRGAAGGCFVRWWARGIEEWWQDKLGSDAPLAGCDISRRVETLSQTFGNLVALNMPKGSLGARPWRYCLLTKEQRDEVIPVDPARAIKVRPRSPMPSWLDPLYASLGVALQNRDDPRLDKDDMKRLQLYARSSDAAGAA
ncbi:hypothetical protein [Sphingomonas sp.]|uniref:hypothetical protein n=1 Tax=Sphingomonas sp. TaxID=28214 RepID=UPI003BAD63DC